MSIVSSKKGVIGLDTETLRCGPFHKFFSFQAFCPDLHLSMVSYNPEDLNLLFSHRTRTYRILAFNLEFDLAVLRKVLPPEFTIDLYYNKSRLVYAKVRRGKHSWKCLDMGQIFTGWSLDRLGKMLGLPKLPRPDFLGKRPWQTPEEKEYFERYALRDAEICWRAGQWIQERFGSLRPTLPSLVFHYFLEKHRPRGLFPKIVKEEEAFLRRAYKGGRTECFIRGSPDRRLRMYDVVSLYPYVMKHMNFPNFSSPFSKGPHLDLDHEGIASVQVRVESQIPPLAFRTITKDGMLKLTFPEGKFKGTWTLPELRYLERTGEGKIEKVFWAMTWRGRQNYTASFVDEFFTMKQKDPEGKDFWKLCLNSLYGKFAEKGQVDIYRLKGDGQMERMEGKERRKWRPKRNVVMGAYATAYGRLVLHEIFRKVGYDHVFYCDTDSVVTDRSLPVDGGKLGSLKLEIEGEGTFVRSKFYCLGDVVRIRGLPIFLTRTWTGEDFRQMLERNDPKFLCDVLLRIRAACVRHLPLLSEVQMVKDFSLQPDWKRIPLEDLEGKDLVETSTETEPLDLKGEEKVKG